MTHNYFSLGFEALAVAIFLVAIVVGLRRADVMKSDPPTEEDAERAKKYARAHSTLNVAGCVCLLFGIILRFVTPGSTTPVAPATYTDAAGIHSLADDPAGEAWTPSWEIDADAIAPSKSPSIGRDFGANDTAGPGPRDPSMGVDAGQNDTDGMGPNTNLDPDNPGYDQDGNPLIEVPNSLNFETYEEYAADVDQNRAPYDQDTNHNQDDVSSDFKALDEYVKVIEELRRVSDGEAKGWQVDVGD